MLSVEEFCDSILRVVSIIESEVQQLEVVVEEQCRMDLRLAQAEVLQLRFAVSSAIFFL